MSSEAAVEQVLAQLAAASEALVALLEQRDPRYLEQLERRQELLAALQGMLDSASPPPPSLRAALERVRQLGEAAERQAHALRREALDEISALDPHLRFAQSLSLLAAPRTATLVDVEG